MDNCPIHNQPYKLVPAGISKKTGKGYPAFYTCPEFGCTQKPPKEDTFESDKQDFLDAVEPTKAPEKPEVDWDSKERRMVRMNVLNRATDLVVADKVDIKQIESVAEKLERWIYRVDDNETSV